MEQAKHSSGVLSKCTWLPLLFLYDKQWLREFLWRHPDSVLHHVNPQTLASASVGFQSGDHLVAPTSIEVQSPVAYLCLGC